MTETHTGRPVHHPGTPPPYAGVPQSGVPAPGTPGTPVGAASPHPSDDTTGRPHRPTRRTLGHEPALDGLRGLAVTAVLLYHLGQANSLDRLQDVSAGGFLGVSAFLTLSGFLITSLLILEFESIGHISLGGFWSRRFRRLLPASLLTLGLVGILTPLIGTENQLRQLPGEIWSALGYVANWHFVLTGSDYAATFNGAPSPLKHFWSLAVEEQSYFLLPFVVAIAMRFGGHRRRVVGTAFAVIALGSTALMIVLGGGEYTNRVYMGTDTRIGELAIGGLLAVFVAGRTRARTTPGHLLSVVGGPLAFLAILFAWATTDLQEDWLYRGGYALHAVAVAVIIWSVLQPDTPLHRALAWRPFTEIGRISYGIYLFHWPVVWWLTASRLHVPAAVAALIQVAVTVALAEASYRLLEHPIRSRRWIVGWQRAVVPAGTVVAVAVLAAFLPAPDKSRIVALDASKEAVIPTTQVPSDDAAASLPPVRVMVVGDSFALSVGLGLENWAKSEAKIGTLNTGLVGCGFGRGGENRGIGLERPWPEDCATREQRLLDQMAVFQPDVVLCAGGMWDVTDRRLEGSTTWTHIGEPDYDAYLLGEFQHMTDVLGSTGATVVWATAPEFDPQYNPQTYMGKPPYSEARAGRSDRYNEVLREAMSTRPDAHVIDLAAWMDEYPGGEFAPDLRIDGVHFTEESTDLVAEEFLGPELVQIGREDR